MSSVMVAIHLKSERDAFTSPRKHFFVFSNLELIEVF